MATTTLDHPAAWTVPQMEQDRVPTTGREIDVGLPTVLLRPVVGLVADLQSPLELSPGDQLTDLPSQGVRAVSMHGVESHGESSAPLKE